VCSGKGIQVFYCPPVQSTLNFAAERLVVDLEVIMSTEKTLQGLPVLRKAQCFEDAPTQHCTKLPTHVMSLLQF